MCQCGVQVASWFKLHRLFRLDCQTLNHTRLTMGKRASGDGAPAAAKKPKAKEKAASKKPKSSDAALDGGSILVVGDDSNMCAKILGQVHDAVNKILAHDVFKNIVEAPPLPIGEGGLQSAFNQEECEKVLKATPKELNLGDGHAYQCAGNFMWQSFTWLANHRVPVNMGQVKDQWAPSLS